MPLQAIVFDLDGTLLDQEGAERDALQLLYERDLNLASKPPYHAFLRDWRNVADEYLQRFLDNKMGFDEQRIARIQAVYKKYGSPLDFQEAERLHQAYAGYYRGQWRAFDDALPALRSLGRRFKLAVITNGDGPQQRAKLEATSLSPLFADIVVSGEVKVRKPDPAIFRLSEKALGLPAESLAYVGDRLDVDVAGAKAAGWTALWLDRKGMPGRSSEAGTLVADSLKDLDSLLA
ncbi:MAG TPA: HAD family hydrolase [bacterium]|jgi:putative hydrolase of the HAD superfamily|nr:HAD family hydrolase [bacterium]